MSEEFDRIVDGITPASSSPEPVSSEAFGDYMKRKATGRAVIFILLTFFGSVMILWLPATIVLWAIGKSDASIILSGIVSLILGVVMTSIAIEKE